MNTKTPFQSYLELSDYGKMKFLEKQNRMLKDCIKALIRSGDREVIGDIMDGKIEDEDKCATFYITDFKTIMKCLEAFPELKPTIINAKGEHFSRSDSWENMDGENK